MDRYTLISADCHAGGNHGDVPRVPRAAYHDEFDALAGRVHATRSATCTGDGAHPQLGRRAPHRRAGGRRRRGRGRVPEHGPAVLPDGRGDRPPADARRSYELRLAGIRAHNRWLADWCADHPERRAGIGQIFLNDVDEAVADVRWSPRARPARRDPAAGGARRHDAHRAALRARPTTRCGRCARSSASSSTHHSGGAGIARLRAVPRRRRAVDRGDQRSSPGARSRTCSSAACSSASPACASCSPSRARRGSRRCSPSSTAATRQMKHTGRIGELKYDARRGAAAEAERVLRPQLLGGRQLPEPGRGRGRATPSASTGTCGAATTPTTRARIPYTREGLRRVVRRTRPEDELQQVLAGNAAARLRLRPRRARRRIAARVGPTVEELSVPLADVPEGNRSPAFYRP